MKNYKKQKYSGNENGWHEPIVTLGVHAMHESQAATLNDQFRNTGIKYEETTILPYEFEKTTTDKADHGEPNLVVKDGEFVKTTNKPKEKANTVAKEAKHTADTAPDIQKKAKVTDKDAFVKSDGEVLGAEIDAPKGE